MDRGGGKVTVGGPKGPWPGHGGEAGLQKTLSLRGHCQRRNRQGTKRQPRSLSQGLSSFS